MQKSAGEPGGFKALVSPPFTYAASSGAAASAEVSILVPTMLQKTSCGAFKLSRRDDVIGKWYKIHLSSGDVPALWEMGHRWAMGAFPRAHERPLVAEFSFFDFGKLSNVEHREYDLLLPAASSGCLTYTAGKVTDGTPVEIPERQPLLSAVLHGVVALNLRGLLL